MNNRAFALIVVLSVLVLLAVVSLFYFDRLQNPEPRSKTEGCYYQEVQCITAPCDPILVCPRSPKPEVANPTTKQECDALGGKWESGGITLEMKCFLKKSDAGKTCIDGNQCESRRCLAQEGAKRGTTASGKCDEWDKRYGCYTTVQDGKVLPMICVD